MFSPFPLFADVAIFPGGAAAFVCGTFGAVIALTMGISFGVLYILRKRVKKRIEQSKDAESTHSAK